MKDVSPQSAAAAGSLDVEETDQSSEQEPILAGTLFLTLIFLMMVFGFWIVMYLTLLNL